MKYTSYYFYITLAVANKIYTGLSNRHVGEIDMGVGRIENNSWIGVNIYNTNDRGKRFNKEFYKWIDKHLTMVNHQCFNEAKMQIYNPRVFTDGYVLFGVCVEIQTNEIPKLFNNKCIFCINLEQTNLNKEDFTNDEKEITEFYKSLKELKNSSTVPTTKTLFAWWPDLFIPIDRTHNYNNIVFEFQTYGVNLPINRSNEIQNINGVKYIKMLRVIQYQLHRWITKYNKSQTDLRRIDGFAKDCPFLRVIDKNYW